MVQNVAGSIHLSINPTVNKYLYYVKCLVGDAWLWCRIMSSAWLEMLVMVQKVTGSIHLSINPTVNKYLYYVKCLVGDAWLWCRMFWFYPSFYQPNSKQVPVLCQVLGGSIHLSINPTEYLLGYGAECCWFYPSFYQPNSKQVPVLCQVLGWRCLVMVQNVAGSIHLSINPTVNKYLYYVKCLVGDAWLWCRSAYQPNSSWRCLVMVQNVAGSVHLSINPTVNGYLYYVKCLVGDAWLWCRMWPTVNKYLYYVKCLVGDAWLWCRMLLVLSIFLST